MTKPVQAYAAVSPAGRLDCDTVGRSEETAKIAAEEWYEPEIPIHFKAVTILPTEQYEAMVASLGELVAAMHRYEGWAEADAPIEHLEMMARAESILAALKEQDHG